MPTWEDNIGDAPDLLGAGTDSVSNVGATEETNENSMIGWPTVWSKIDLSSYPALDVEITIEATGAGGFEPYIEVMKVIDGTFDPNSPDFTKLDYMTGTFVGNGTTTDSSTFNLKGGTTGSSGSGTDYRSETGVFYVFFTDWNFAGSGSASVEYTVPEAPECVQAEDVINADSPTASVVSGRVREDYDGYDAWNNLPEGQRDAALKWTWAGPAGLYKVTAIAQGVSAGSPAQGVFRIVISVNGNPIIPSAGTSLFSFNTDTSWNPYPGFPTGGSVFEYVNDYGEAPWVPLKGGDLVEVFMVSTVLASGSFAWVPMSLETLCFYPDPLAPTSTYCTPGFAFGDEPLGDAWGSPNGWGGQMLVPDEIWTETGITPYDEGNFPWGVGATDYDFVALEDGTVYVVIRESYTTGGFTGPGSANYKSYVAVKKYDAGTWTQIATLNVHDPDDKHPAEGVSAATDGTNVYFAWWEEHTFTTPKELWKWHLVHLDPSTDTITELGTGQNARTVVTSTQNYPQDVLAPDICCDEGELYVAAVEFTDASPGDRRLHVWHWTGGSWVDTSLPDPSGAPAGWDVSGENGFYDRLSSMCIPPGGDGPTLVYSYTYFDGVGFVSRLETISYDGASWGGEFISQGTVVEGDRVATAANDYHWIDMDLLWSAKLGRLVLAVDFLAGANGNVWDVLKLNDDGDAWEPYNDIAPGSVSGDWRQSRNTAAIGPDGEVYRALMSEHNLGTDFYPKIVKTTDGYLAGFAVASGPQTGEATGPNPTWQVYMNATANYRIRIVGQVAYVMGNFEVWTYDHDVGDSSGFDEFSNGFFVFRCTYVPCRRFRPQVYRRIHG